MKSIEIDFEVYKHLTMMRETEEVSYNDVIRRLLNLGQRSNGKSDIVEKGKKPFVTKGVSFPHGTKFKANYKGKNYYAEVQDGALVYEGERHTSPSSAAIAITGNSVNGWIFWECQFPGQSVWRSIKKLRED